jgi:hypothetical protein
MTSQSDTTRDKSEIRNPKSETTSNDQSSKFKTRRLDTSVDLKILGPRLASVGISDFDIVSDFEIRISDFLGE